MKFKHKPVIYHGEDSIRLFFKDLNKLYDKLKNNYDRHNNKPMN